LPELIRILETEMLYESKRLSELMEIFGIERFAERMVNLGKIYRLRFLMNYGESLSEFANNIELDKISNMLKVFHKTIERVNRVRNSASLS